MIEIDGSFGEGGGQMLRSSLTMSLLTGKPFEINSIRSGRPKPGLLRQHLTAVNAAAAVGNAEVSGNHAGSQKLSFFPGKVTPGDYEFAVGTAGSATLVLQTLLPALISAGRESTVTVEGGTHNAFAPTFDFFKNCFLGIINRTGPQVEAELLRYGFYPAGGGKIIVRVKPSEHIGEIRLTDRGPVKRTSAESVYSGIPGKIAADEIRFAQKALEIPIRELKVKAVDSNGPGNILQVQIETESHTEIISAFGGRNISREEVAETAVRECMDYLGSGAVIGGHLADQLIIPMCMARKGSFTTVKPSMHTLTNIEVVKKFTDISFTITGKTGNCFLIETGEEK